MVRVRVTFSAALANVKERKLDVEASTVGEVLNLLATKYGERFKEEFFNSGRTPKRFINVYVNGKEIRFLKGLDTTLGPDDDVTILPAVSGG